MEITLAYEEYLTLYRYKYLALYHALRTSILEGILPGKTRLPSTRRLAELYKISRGSAAQVYDMLLADGYVTTERGSGTFVCSGPWAPLIPDAVPASKEVPLHVPLTAWGRRLLDHPVPPTVDHRGDGISFIGGGMPMEYFPYAEWRSALAHAGGKGGAMLDSSGPVQGDEGLRSAIAAHLRITRGIRAEAAHIVLFSGSMQGIVILIQLLLEQGSPAVIEDPGYYGIRRAVEIAGAIPVCGRVDDKGLVPENWSARLLFVTPSRQYPTGAVLPLERRRELLKWARNHEAIIVEDDYDSEFRWGGRPIEPLKALDGENRVVYMGSFSKVMFSGLRLGYALLPPSLVEPVIAAKGLYEPLPAGLLEQRALARFIAQGEYGRHLRRMTRIYGERGRLLRHLLAQRLKGVFHALPGDAGLHVYAEWLRSGEEFAALQATAHKRGVEFRDAAMYRACPGTPAACFVFSHLDAAGIEKGVERLVLAWNDVQKAT